LHGKHVVCTKPFIDDLSKAAELLDLVEKSGKRVFVGQSSRFFEPMKKQRKDYEAGLIGDLITIEGLLPCRSSLVFGETMVVTKSFKWLYGGLSHPVDFIRWYLPNIEEVMGYGMLSSKRSKGWSEEPGYHAFYI
jgi:predicted dehydrogenase